MAIIEQLLPTCPHCNVKFLLNVVDPVITPIPREELDLARQLKDIRVVFDVGARTDIDYLAIWPGAEFHLFEPHPEFFRELERKVKGLPNIYTNNMGLGDKEENRGYYAGLQAFLGNGNAPDDAPADYTLPIQTLFNYVTDNGIANIDYLKIDTEGHDLQVLIGADTFRHHIKFIQYEHWGKDNNDLITSLLQDEFEILSVGYRNMFCMNKSLISGEERTRLKTYILENKLNELV